MAAVKRVNLIADNEGSSTLTLTKWTSATAARRRPTMAKSYGGVRGSGPGAVKKDPHAVERAEFKSYGEDWDKTYFDESTGGYVVTEQARLDQASKSKQEKDKYDKERHMCEVAAQNGMKVEHLKDGPGEPDARIEGELHDLKSTGSHNNMAKYAKHAVREQGAKGVFFELTKDTAKIRSEIQSLSRQGIHGKYYFTSDNKVHDF